MEYRGLYIVELFHKSEEGRETSISTTGKASWEKIAMEFFHEFVVKTYISRRLYVIKTQSFNDWPKHTFD